MPILARDDREHLLRFGVDQEEEVTKPLFEKDGVFRAGTGTGTGTGTSAFHQIFQRNTGM